ncbi:GTPase [Mangrovitalea sediminis]|uniref:GTPase n=1 Tax=Mangrovitalea sediminis TaxID=1982043 RepID=UPI000BE4FA4E|nr:GTPase [Mangrovitalea sediminis]
MAGTKSTLDLSLPEQKLANLSFCEATPKAIRDWAASLPLANIGEASRQLYHAIIELNQLITPPAQRMLMLEGIRQPIYFICGELSRHFLGHSISLPEKQRKIANLAQALQLHLAGGYKTVLCELAQQNSPEKNKRSLSQAAHRVITDLSATILRSCQLYCPSPAGSWLESHQVFQFCYENKLHNQQVPDETNTHRAETSVSDAYKRLLLLGCCRPNQLRQNELTQAYELFENWTDLVNCRPEDNSDAMFVINLERDAPPLYRSLAPDASSSYCYGFDTSNLSNLLTEYLALKRERRKEADALLDVPVTVSESLLGHLSQALGILTKRSFKRMSSSGTLQVCLGLSALHYYCSGQVEFSQFVKSHLENHDHVEDDENIFLSRARRREDAWAGAFDAGPGDSFVSPDTPIQFRGADGRIQNGTEKGVLHKQYRVSLINTSPGGYCLNWDAEVPATLQAGEILGVREQNEHPWSIAVIRWIRQVRQQGTQVGVELLAPNAAPCGVRLIQKVGNSSEFLRGLLLPELSAIGQPATLIAPRLPFQTGNRISLLHDSREDQCQLNRRISATGSVSQFELKFINLGSSQGGQGNESNGRRSNQGGTSEDEFDSLWPSL